MLLKKHANMIIMLVAQAALALKHKWDKIRAIICNKKWKMEKKKRRKTEEMPEILFKHLPAVRVRN